jgi:hypothetical protein
VSPAPAHEERPAGAAGYDPRLLATSGTWTVEARDDALARAPAFGRRFFAGLFERIPDLRPAVSFLRWSEQPDDVYAVFSSDGGFAVQVDPDLEYLVVWDGDERAEFGDWDGDQVVPALAFVAELIEKPAAATPDDGNRR